MIFFFQAEDGIRDDLVTGVQTCALPISGSGSSVSSDGRVKVTLPGANDIITSPVSVVGTVTGGGWLFEASFPVKVLDGDGTVLGQSTAQAGGEWVSMGNRTLSPPIKFQTTKF